MDEQMVDRAVLSPSGFKPWG